MKLLQFNVGELRLQVTVRRALALACRRRRHLLLLDHVLLNLLYIRHVLGPDVFQLLVEHERDLLGSELRHDLAVRSMTVKHSEEPVERLSVLREGLDDLERVLVDLRRQHGLVLLLLALVAAVA